MKPSSLVILVCGLAGSGKSALADNLAREFNLKCVHTGDILRQLRSEESASIETLHSKASSGFWESREALQFTKERFESGDLDKKLDSKLLELIDQGNVVMDSWTMPYLSRKGFKIWLEAPEDVRLQRIVGRDQLSLDQIRSAVHSREEQSRILYRKLYNFEFGDTKPFHLVINTANLNQVQVLEFAKAKILAAKSAGFFDPKPGESRQ